MVGSTRPPLALRGSRRRFRRIRFREHWSAGMSWLVIWIVIVLGLIVPWLVRTADNESDSTLQRRRQPRSLTSDHR